MDHVITGGSTASLYFETGSIISDRAKVNPRMWVVDEIIPATEYRVEQLFLRHIGGPKTTTKRISTKQVATSPTDVSSKTFVLVEPSAEAIL